MSEKRQERISEAYKKEISDIIINQIRDPRLEGVYITQVTITPDLRLAKIYFDHAQGREKKKQLEKGFAKSMGFIKRELAARVNLKYMPELKFFHDDSSEMKLKIDEIFKKIENENHAQNQDQDN